ncbi:MAG: LysR family transcriptional regulator [Fournierella sp.]|uniref:LysR family transcriptional regulator n=1 Tax=Allofournierella sp. TaxID=1940256 RepID=UPI002A83D23C|nr:LysR family transcriptional regulator [Fournierella sp.]MDY4166032.1 LysR family transcriptional regulator [Fournierella sp.]
MELRVLQYFLAVAREQNISSAAESLHLSQPTLSTQLKALENELGKQLLIRGTKGSRKVLLTEEGMLLRKRAEEILELVRMTESEISLSNEVIAGDVYIGTGESDLIRIFARAAKHIQEKHPDIHYHILSGNAAFVQEHLDRGLIDFGVVYSPVDTSIYNTIKIPVHDTWGVLMRRDSPLAQKDTIQPQDLLNKPLILSAQKTDAWPLSNWFGQDISKLNVVATYNLVFNASLLVEEGLGYAVCFDKLINVSGDSNLCFRPLSPTIEAKASIIWKRYQVLSKAAECFLNELQQEMELLTDL